MQLIETKIWQELSSHKSEIETISLQELFKNNPNRFTDLSFKVNDILVDFSKQKINSKTLELFEKLLEHCGAKQKIQAMFNQEKINNTENRAVFHVGLRSKTPISPVKKTLQKMQDFVTKLNSQEYVGATGKSITDIISIGIGGSDLGPRMVVQALDAYKTSKINFHFLSNVDSSTVVNILGKLNPHTTICLINTKSFKTLETLALADIIKAWFIDSLPSFKPHMIAVTANPAKAIEYGIDIDHIFELWDWVGGRYSIWSAVGLPVAIALGMDQFYEFLDGANAIDDHFYKTEVQQNIPMLMALIGAWNNNLFQHETLAVMPYLDRLELFPAYLQQLEMESNGKSVNIQDNEINYKTAPVIWGGVGCNNQHAYMQLLHQGTQTVPVDFIVVVNNDVEMHHELNKILFASCIGQSQALLHGTNNNVTKAKICKGNKPSTTIVLNKLSPSTLGSLIALYEHKVFIQGIIWQIQSFDQFGVEIGKTLINNLLPLLTGSKLADIDKSEIDDSTFGLLRYYMENSKT